ncbi:MAG: IS1/IS1595 family N-terminal zinc-binding domain-containing protein [Thermoplasmataceae archaeon]
MRLRKAPYTEFGRVSTSLDNFTSMDSSPVFLVNNIPMMDMELKENDLISFMNPACPQCSSRHISRNGTCERVMENGTVFRVQRYICRDCGYSFVARPPNYGYGKHYPDDVMEKGALVRVKTSLRKAASLFRILGNVIISHETIRRYVPTVSGEVMESSGYFVYDEQYAHIDGKEKYRALLKDAKTGNFVEEMLDDLTENTLFNFFMKALSRFIIPEEIFITTDGYHYESVLERVSSDLNVRIRRQRCLFHIEKDLAHRIKDAKKDRDLDTAKKLIKYMFFQNEDNLKKLGKNREAVIRLTENKNEKEVVDIILYKLNSLYGDEEIIRGFLDFVRKHRREVFLYLENHEVEKTSGIAEQHFSIQSWLFKHRFKTKEGLLRTSFWYHRYLSTGM